jgi:hypothetical protein
MELSCHNPPLIPPLVVDDFFMAKKKTKGDYVVKSGYFLVCPGGAQ